MTRNDVPRGFEVREVRTALPPGDPYRSPGAIRERPALRIRWQVRDPARWYALASAASWLGVALATTGIVVAVGGAIGGLAAYLAASHRFGWNQLRVDGDAVVAAQRPLPRARSRRLRAGEIAELYVVPHPDGREHVVRARLDDGTDRDLARAGSSEDARWLAARIEQHLAIAKAPGDRR